MTLASRPCRCVTAHHPGGLHCPMIRSETTASRLLRSASSAIFIPRAAASNLHGKAFSCLTPPVTNVVDVSLSCPSSPLLSLSVYWPVPFGNAEQCGGARALTSPASIAYAAAAIATASTSRTGRRSTLHRSLRSIGDSRRPSGSVQEDRGFRSKEEGRGNITMEDSAAEGKKNVLQGRYELGRVLGHGNFGRVHAARDLRTGRGVAVKVVAKDKVERAGMVEQIKREIAVMKMVSHPNIVELHEVMATRSKIYLALELVRGGELFARISRAGRLREDVARRYFRQLVSAVDFCHGRGVYHRDLKPENLLLDEAGNLKVADFGLSALACHARPDGLLHTACGTPAYVAPEVLGGNGYDGAKADIWSCGVILYVLLVGALPFQDENLMCMYRKMQRGDFLCPSWVSKDARKLIGRLLDPNPSSRIAVASLIESPWFKKTSPMPDSLGEPAPSADARGKGEDKDEPPEALNAFHLISLSAGFDLSPLFDQEASSGRGAREGAMRFATREPASGVISRLEGLANGGAMRVTKSGARGVRLEGAERGRKGRLGVAAEFFSVAPSVLVVDVKKDGGDTMEYRSFCSDELRPALKDIVWAAAAAAASGASTGDPPAAAI